jgi:hypothetical protein
MTTPSLRSARARDYVLTGLGASFLSLAAVFVAGRIWFRGLFAAAAGVDPLVWAGCFLAVAVALGILHTFAPAPLSNDAPPAYKGQD